jgi:hypothetical protein
MANYNSGNTGAVIDAQIDKMESVTASATELNYVGGVTSAIQTQMDTKAPLASPTLTGTPIAPTAGSGTDTTQIATTAFVQSAVQGEDTLAEMNDTSLSSPDDSDFLVHNGTAWVNESGATARTSLGVDASGTINYTHPNHSGDVTSVSDGATTIANDAVTYAKMQNVSATDRILGRDTSGAGIVEEITPANVRAMINVEDGSTADQSNAEIKTAYEANADTNEFSDAEQTKLSGIEASADVTDSTNVNSAGAVMESDISGTPAGSIIDDDTMASASNTTLATSESIKAYAQSLVASSVEYIGGYNASTNSPDLDTSPSGVTKGDMYTVTTAGTFFTQDLEVGDVLISEQDSPTALTHWSVVNKDLDASSIKTSYESNADTNAYTDAEVTKLSGIATSATANDTDANLKARANHTGTQTASTISDFDTEVANNSAVTTNTAKVSNVTHTGDVTGSTSLSIASDVVGATELGVTAGTATASKALVVDSSKDINLGTGDLTATNLTGTLQTASQTNITSTGKLTGFESTGIDDNASGTMITLDTGANADVNIDARGTGDIILGATTGNVGIGTDSPATRLHLYEANSATNAVVDMLHLQLISTGTAANGLGAGITWQIEDADDAAGEEQASLDVVMTDVSSTAEDSAMVFSVQKAGAITETMRLVSGNVGIGTASPSIGGAYGASNALTIDGGTSSGVEDTAVLEIGGSTNTGGRYAGMLAFYNADNSGAAAATRKQLAIIRTEVETSDTNSGVDSGGHLSFLTKPESGALATRMHITSAGNVGIGVTSPDVILHTYVNADSAFAQFEGNAGKWVFGQAEATHAQVAGLYGSHSGIAVTTTGNVGIGDTSPSYQLELSTNSAAKPTSTLWTVPSDERLKDDIVLADLDKCYDIIQNLPLKRFKWKEDVYTNDQTDDRSVLGWIAQDVQSVFPKSVKENNFRGVSNNDAIQSIEAQDAVEWLDNPSEDNTKDEIKAWMDSNSLTYNSGDTKTDLIAKIPELKQEAIKAVVGADETFKLEIEDCLSIDADQIFRAMFGAIQKLQAKVEALENA